MRFLLFFEGIFFSSFYSLTPFFFSDLITKPVFGFYIREPAERTDIRHSVAACISFLFFYFFSVSGMRTRYMIWHLEQNRSSSGFVPVETIAVAMYHTMVLCILSESIAPLIDQQSPEVLSALWIQYLGFRMKNIFFLSIIQHFFLELSGFCDKVRRDYFDLARI